jgi:transcription elongation factor
MSTLELENIKHPDNSGDNIALASNGSITIDRKSTDGTIAEFRKDGTAVGSIGTSGGDLIISGRTSSAKSGIRFDNNTITPAVNGADVDASVDLGYSSRRFKDAYLSGGVYLGGTGSDNKLDDYEEGTWTPAVYQAGFTISSFTARYTKIGRLVTVTCDCGLSGTGNGNDMKISGLPFTSLSNGHASGAGYTQYYPGVQNGSNAAFIPKSGNNDTFVYFQNGNGARYDGDRFSAGFLNFTITYFTS